MRYSKSGVRGGIGSALLVAALAIALPGCDDDTATAPGAQVPIMNDFGSKIVYGTSRRLNVSALRADCAERQGTFNECGTICAPGAEGCATVCAFTCENIPD